MEKPIRSNYKTDKEYLAAGMAFLKFKADEAMQKKGKQLGRDQAVDDVMNPTIREEEHPDVGYGERWRAKNLGKDIKSIIATAKEDHPDVDVIEHKGRVLFRDKGAPTGTDWNVLDPSKDFMSLETVKDAGDIVTDVTGAASEIAGGLGGGILGAPTGPGAIGTAALGAGAAGAAHEGIRQLLGKWAGMKQDVSPVDMAISGGMAGIGNLAFGSGAGGKQLMKKGVKKGVAKIAQGGLLWKPAQWSAQKTALFGKLLYDSTTEMIPRSVASLLTGIKAKTWDDYLKNPETIKVIDKLGIAGYSEKEIKKLMDTVQATYHAADKGYREFEKSGKKVNVSEVKKIFTNQRDKLEKARVSGRSDTLHSIQIGEIDKIVDNVFKSSPFERPIPHNELKRVADQEIDVASKVVKAKDFIENAKDIKAPTKAETEANIKKAAEVKPQFMTEAQQKLNDIQKKSVDNLVELENAKKVAAERAQLFGPQNQGQLVPTETVRNDLSGNIDVDQLYDMRQSLDKYADWNNPKKGRDPISEETTSLSNSAKQKLSDEASNQLTQGKGLNYSDLINMWSRSKKGEGFIESNFKNPGKQLGEQRYNKKGARFMNQAADQSDKGRPNRELLEDFDMIHGTKSSKVPDMINAHQSLRKAPFLPVSMRAPTAMAAVGGGIGGGIDRLSGNKGESNLKFGGIGATIGFGAGALMGSPAIWKGLLKAAGTPKNLAKSVTSKVDAVASKTGMTKQKAKQLILRGLLNEAQQQERNDRTPGQDKAMRAKPGEWSSAIMKMIKGEE